MFLVYFISFNDKPKEIPVGKNCSIKLSDLNTDLTKLKLSLILTLILRYRTDFQQLEAKMSIPDSQG